MSDTRDLKNRLFQALSITGDGTGVMDATGDYSSNPAEFFIEPPSDEVFHIRSFLLYLVDNSNLKQSKYGANLVLTNGIDIKVSGDSTPSAKLNPFPIIVNTDWGIFLPNIVSIDFDGGGSKAFVANRDLSEDSVFTLQGSKNERFSICLSDNFTGLDHQFFIVSGRKEAISN